MIGIVVLNYKSFDDTVKCVQSILGTVKENAFRIYIVDNKSPDSSFDKLLKQYKDDDNIKVIQSGKNGGYSYGNNVGVRVAAKDHCDAILISNTDIVYFENSVDSMYKKLFQNDHVAVVGPDMIDSQGNYCQINLAPPTLKNYWKTKKPFNLFKKNQNKNQKYNNDYQFRGMVQGSSFMIKTNVFSQINYFDENVFLFGEELILAHKLNLLQLDTVIDSDALILHDHSQTISKEGVAFERFHVYFSTVYVLKQYVKCNYINLSLAILHSISFYGFRAIFSKSYRSRYRNLVKKLFSLY